MVLVLVLLLVVMLLRILLLSVLLLHVLLLLLVTHLGVVRLACCSVRLRVLAAALACLTHLLVVGLVLSQNLLPHLLLSLVNVGV